MVLSLFSRLLSPSNKLLRNQIQYLFLFMLILVIPFLATFLKEFNSIVEFRRKGNPEYPWPKYSDLLISVYTTMIFIVSYIIFHKVFTPTAETLIAKKYQGKERAYKREKLVDCVFKGSYYVFVTIYNYIAMKDSFFLGVYLGGKGRTDDLFLGFPYQELKDYEFIRTFIMIQLGYHTFSLLQHVYKDPKNDFIEMLLHHIMTVSLIALAYFMNYITMSCLVLFCHDASDVFGYLVRIFVDTEYKSITLASYIGLLLSWFYLRILVFPFDLIRSAVYSTGNPELYGKVVLGGMLHFLLVLHCYWFYLFIKMGLKFLATKETADTYHVE